MPKTQPAAADGTIEYALSYFDRDTTIDGLLSQIEDLKAAGVLRLRLEIEDDYGGNIIVVYATRPATEAEIAERERLTAETEARHAAHERAEFERLKRKLGGS